MNIRLFATLATILMVVGTFVLLRVVVPGLVNAQNDGALILVVLIALGGIAGWWYFIDFLQRLLKGDFN